MKANIGFWLDDSTIESAKAPNEGWISIDDDTGGHVTIFVSDYSPEVRANSVTKLEELAMAVGEQIARLKGWKA